MGEGSMWGYNIFYGKYEENIRKCFYFVYREVLENLFFGF